jgi:hypothetical protein
MIRLIAVATLALAVTTSAEAMSPAPLHQSDGIITQARQARPCHDPNQVRINGICRFWARHVSRAEHRCVWWTEGLCIEYYEDAKALRP